ncbi:MAG: DUF3047 domain-containing protein [Gemmatimonadales bacterium]
MPTMLIAALAWLTFAPPLDILRLDRPPLASGIPAGWQIREVRGQTPPEASIRFADGQAAFAIAGAGRAAWFYREFDAPLPESAGKLEWTWRIIAAPGQADMRDRKLDDSPIRVFVVFGKPGGLFGGSGRVIFYTHGNDEPAGFARRSHVSSRMHVVRMDGAASRSTWQDHTVEPFADYRRIWHRDPPAITAIGVMQDTDQTRGHAEAEIRRLVWRVP